jgi:hypothetical protein
MLEPRLVPLYLHNLHKYRCRGLWVPREHQETSYRSLDFALPKGVHQPAVLEADLQVAPERQLGEHPIRLFHRNPP